PLFLPSHDRAKTQAKYVVARLEPAFRVTPNCCIVRILNAGSSHATTYLLRKSAQRRASQKQLWTRTGLMLRWQARLWADFRSKYESPPKDEPPKNSYGPGPA